MTVLRPNSGQMSTIKLPIKYLLIFMIFDMTLRLESCQQNGVKKTPLAAIKKVSVCVCHVDS